MQTAVDRLSDTGTYLASQLTMAQYNEVANLYNNSPNKLAIDTARSLGHKNPFNTNSRKAKRALILLASISSLESPAGEGWQYILSDIFQGRLDEDHRVRRAEESHP